MEDVWYGPYRPFIIGGALAVSALFLVSFVKAVKKFTSPKGKRIRTVNKNRVSHFDDDSALALWRHTSC